ncbi:MAG: hypothetical protein PWQ48_1550 [Thermotogaceae bacterium]|nr:hypothetical protein [Thermotogaceae bacterium]
MRFLGYDKKKKQYHNRLGIILSLIVLFPNFYNLYGNSYLSHRATTFFVTFACLFMLLYWNRGNLRFKSSGYVLVIAGIMFLEIIYRLVIILLFSKTLSLVDVLDVFRVVVYLFFFILPVVIIYEKDMSEVEEVAIFIRNVLVALSIIEIVVSLGVFFPTFYPVMNLLKGRQSTDRVFFQFLRFSGTLGYPADLGFFLIFPLNILLLEFVLKSRRSSIMLYTILLFGEIMTASRASIAALGISHLFSALFCLLCISKNRAKLFIKFSLFSLIITLTISSLLWGLRGTSSIGEYYIEYVLKFVEKGFYSDESSYYRLNEIVEGWQISKSTLFGYGASKEYFSTYHGPVESLYYYYLAKWGIFGFGFIIFFAGIVITKLVKTAKIISTSKKYQSVLIFLLSNASVVASVFVFGVGSTFFRNKTPLYFYYIIGVSLFLVSVIKEQTFYSNKK